MKFTEVKTLEHLLKEYATPVGQQTTGNTGIGSIAKKMAGQAGKSLSKKVGGSVGSATSMAGQAIKGADSKTTQRLKSIASPKTSKAKITLSPTINGERNIPEPVVKTKAGKVEKGADIYDQYGNYAGKVDSPLGDNSAGAGADAVAILNKNNKYEVKTGDDEVFVQNPDAKEVDEGKLSKIANRRGKKRKIKKLKSILKKINRKRLKEADPKLFEINFNRQSVAKEALDAPVRCGFEAETFFYNAEGRSASDDVDNMSISDVEYEFGDLPDSAYEYYQDWLREKAMDEYLPDLIDNWIEENRDEDEYILDFMDSGNGPTEDAVEEYKERFAEDDPNEYQNREEDGWEMDNWARDLVNEEYEDEYEDFLRDIANDEDHLVDDAVEEAEGDYDMDGYVHDQYYSMSEFLDDFSYDYSRETSGVEDVANILHNWINANSEFKDFPEYGDYGDTYTTTGWSVEPDSSIDADEGAAAEIISPVFSNPRQMLREMKSLFEWGEDEFGTNNSTGLHVTMSWQAEKKEPNKLKMALLLGDPYLLAEFGRLKNTYTKSQYDGLLKHASELKKGQDSNLKALETELSKGISRDKFQSIHFKGEKDSETGNKLIEFRIAGGSDYSQMYNEVVKAVVRYATVMKAGYDEEAYKKDYVSALYRLLNKSQEPSKQDVDRLAKIDHPVITSAKEIVSKKEYFDVLQKLEVSVSYFDKYKEMMDPNADKEWKQSIKDYKKGTGRDPSWMGESLNEVEEGKPITGYIEPDRVMPSKGAPLKLKSAQEKFGQAMAMLARQIAGGTARAKPRSVNIGHFRKYAGELKLDQASLEKLLVQSIDDANYGDLESDQEKHETLQKGIEKLFKKEIVGKAEFFNPQEFDIIADGLWQFFQSDDVKDNLVLDKLAELFVNVNPRNEKDNVRDELIDFSKKRQKNELYRYLSSSSYNSNIRGGLIASGMLSNRKAIEELKSFLEKYSGYEHPTSRDHHINIRSDDNYGSVYQMNMIQKMRQRLRHINDIQRSDPAKYEKTKTQLIKIGQNYLEELKPYDPVPEPHSWDDVNGHDMMTFRNMEHWNDTLDALVKLSDDDDKTYNFSGRYDDIVLSCIWLADYYKKVEDFGAPKDNFLRSLVKNRFKAIKTFLSEFDKIFQAEGFVNLEKEIAGKDQLDKRNKDFEKNVRDKSLAEINIPSHSWVYIEWSLLGNLKEVDLEEEDNEMTAWFKRTVIKELQGGWESGRKEIYVIPAAHWDQANDANEGLEIIDKESKEDNYYHNWRKRGYQKILQKFSRTYNIKFDELIADEDYQKADRSFFKELNRLNVDVTRKGDSRRGAPGQSDLIKPEELENPKSGEPIHRGSALMWEQSTDDAEQKRFDAFDWSNYPEEFKKAVAEMMKIHTQTYGSFRVAMSDVVDKINQKELNIPLKRENNVEQMKLAAGVEEMEGDSSNSIASSTNWANLSDYLGIERGVNEQGVELLRVVYNRFDGNHNWRPEPDPDACCMPRWSSAVKAAYEYIKKNYNVSAGNYFRKDADGNDGDDVSSMYSNNATTPHYTSEQDYADMRSKYFNFNAMMMNGMQDYMVKSDVNRLVAFLKNTDNDETFKKAVLDSMMREREAGAEPNDFQGHLARGRQYLQSISVESVFDKFDALPLEEQLIKLQKIDRKKINKVFEAGVKTLAYDKEWDRMHSRDNIQVARPNPMKVVKPYNPAKHKEAMINSKMANQKITRQEAEAQIAAMLLKTPDYFTANADKKRQDKKNNVTESVPNNTKVRMINKILSDHFPASDLKKQMDAYFAIPDPQMLKDFRKRRAEAGEDVCLRPILRNYIQMKLHPKLHSAINLNESKDDLIAKIDALPDDEGTKKLVNYIEQLIDDMGVGGKIQSLSNELEVIDDVDVKKAINQIAKIIASIEMSPQERAQLFVDWKADKLVNVDALLSTSTVSLETIFKGYGEKGESHVTELVDDLNQVVQYGIGPGEFALSVLSQRIEGIGASSGADEDGPEGKGDLLIDSKPIELKTTRKNSARFNDRQVTASDSYKSLVTAFFNKYDAKFKELEEQGIQVRVKSGMQQNHVMAFLKAVPEAEKEVANIISNIFTALNVSGGPIARYLAQGDKNQAMQLIAQSNVNNYLAQKRQSGNLLGILFLDLNKQAFTFIKEVSDLEGTGLRLHAKTNYLITTSENPFANTSIVDTGA